MNITENRIKNIMKTQGWSLGDLSDKTGIPKTTIHRYLSDTDSIPLERLKVISEALNASPEFLLGWDEEDPLSNTIDRIKKSGERIYYANKAMIYLKWYFEDNQKSSIRDLLISVNENTDTDEYIETNNTLFGILRGDNISKTLRNDFFTKMATTIDFPSPSQEGFYYSFDYKHSSFNEITIALSEKFNRFNNEIISSISFDKKVLLLELDVTRCFYMEDDGEIQKELKRILDLIWENENRDISLLTDNKLEIHYPDFQNFFSSNTGLDNSTSLLGYYKNEYQQNQFIDDLEYVIVSRKSAILLIEKMLNHGKAKAYKNVDLNELSEKEIIVISNMLLESMIEK